MGRGRLPRGSLHGWYACVEPERPTDGLVLWHTAPCEGCRVKAEAVLAMGYHAGDLAPVEESILRWITTLGQQ